MSRLRTIRPEEKTLILALLKHAGYNESDFPISNQVSEYGDPYMGGINLNNDRLDLFDSDITQGEYTDTDGENVVMSLTKDTEGNLLDLDFWKSNFTPLAKYPTPELVTFKEKTNSL